MAYGVRSGFQFTSHAILFRNAISTRELAYSDIIGYDVVQNPHLGVYLLNLEAKGGTRNMTIWLDKSQIEGDIARWCASIPCTGCASTYHGDSPDAVAKEWHDLLMCQAPNS